MSTAIPGFSSPAAGFDEPLQMLAACHERMRRQCATLLRLMPHVESHGADEQARSAAQAVLRYFDTAAVHHHQDEEQNLFPALIESMAASDATCLHEITRALANDHLRLDALWRSLRPSLVAIAAGQPDARPEAAKAYVEACTAHLQREDDEILPMAQRLLDAAALSEMGTAMRRRREQAS